MMLENHAHPGKELTTFMRTEAVFFDMGGTLAYGEPDAWQIFIDVCLKHGASVTRDEIDGSKAKVDPEFESRQFLTEELLEMYPIRRYQLILEGLGIHETLPIVEEMQATMKKEGKVILYDDVMEVLAELDRRKFFLGILSNATCMLEVGCKRLGIWDFFDLILASDLILSSKPRRLMFDLAVKEAGVEAEACLHVGDSFRADFEGARRAGLQALLLDRDGTGQWDCPAITDLRGVLDLVLERC